MRVVAAGVMADPGAVGMNVGRVGVAGGVAKVAMLLNVRRATEGRRATCGSGMSTASTSTAATALTLGLRREGQ